MMYAPASRLMMRKNIPAIVSAGRAAGSMSAIMICVVFMHTRSAVHHVFVKDYVSCLSMLARHTLEASGASAFALLRCGGGDGKRLSRRDGEVARRAAVIKPTDPRSRG